jgi:hypothetical protein
MIRALCILSAVLAGACSKPPPSPWEKLGVHVVNGVPQLDEVEIELERTECLGWCPAYTMKVSGTGALAYTGVSYVKTKGEHTAAFDPQLLLPILERFQEVDFLGHEHAQPYGPEDAPSATLQLRIGSRVRRYRDGWVDPWGFKDERLLPSAEREWYSKLYEIMKAIDAAAGTESWIGTAAERDAHREDWR